ncbi:MAG: hypothetical protein M4579_002992 [Chaenotheca gracillima]|nr:MAG: hypothetical protein M4579_002992 [Chaenotheca gracillima]
MDRAIYFAYGSNMSLAQMQQRCSGSQYLGVGVLGGWRWMINERHFANIVPSESDVVYGLLYTLTETDVERLDVNEGVPYAYTRETMSVEVEKQIRGTAPLSTVESLVYVDSKRITDSTPYAEYIERMNQGIVDALEKGVSSTYIDQSLRPFIPPLDALDRLLPSATSD